MRGGPTAGCQHVGPVWKISSSGMSQKKSLLRRKQGSQDVTGSPGAPSQDILPRPGWAHQDQFWSVFTGSPGVPPSNSRQQECSWVNNYGVINSGQGRVWFQESLTRKPYHITDPRTYAHILAVAVTWSCQLCAIWLWAPGYYLASIVALSQILHSLMIKQNIPPKISKKNETWYAGCSSFRMLIHFCLVHLSFYGHVFFFFFACMCIRALYACLVPLEGKRGVRFPGTGVIDRCKLPCKSWKSKLLEEQPRPWTTEHLSSNSPRVFDPWMNQPWLHFLICKMVTKYLLIILR